jgi:2,4-dienoyl-CoA reductase-like NADH-dependent reductase (Old Yellow Enzyme family)
MDLLFQPLNIKSLHLPNRIVMAPMTRYFSPDGIPTSDVAAYYRRRAEGGVGLLISEGTTIARPFAAYDPHIPRFHGAEALAGWQAVIDDVHAAGGRMAPQLWHVGALSDASRTCDCSSSLESPSGLCAPGTEVGVVMTQSDIDATIGAFAIAASQAQRMGFDCVEIHGAHGYLMDQFFWGATNHRSDIYGGPLLAQRTRFATEVLGAVRRAVGADFVISLRLSQWKQQDVVFKLAPTPQALESWLGPLADAGVDVFHCSQRRFWEPEFEGSALNFAGWAKKLTGKRSIAVGSVGLDNDLLTTFSGAESSPSPITKLIAALDREEFDLVAVGRALLADATWAAKLREGRVADMQGFSPAALAVLR